MRDIFTSKKKKKIEPFKGDGLMHGSYLAEGYVHMITYQDGVYGCFLLESPIMSGTIGFFPMGELHPIELSNKVFELLGMLHKNSNGVINSQWYYDIGDTFFVEVDGAGKYRNPYSGREIKYLHDLQLFYYSHSGKSIWNFPLKEWRKSK